MSTSFSEHPPDTNFSSISRYTGGIGYATLLFISLFLLLHLLIAYHKTFISNPENPTDKKKTGYILIMIYLFSVFITAIIYSFGRSNTLTGSNITQFTYHRCLYSLIFGYIFNAINYTLLNIIILHRVYIIFDESVFAYKPIVYRTLLSITILMVILALIIVLGVSIRFDTFTIKYDMTKTIAWCSSDGIDGYYISMIIATIIFAIIQPMLSFILLFLFVRGLWLLNKQKMKEFLKEKVREEIVGTVSPISPDGDENGDFNTDQNVGDGDSDKKRQDKVSMDIVLNEWGKQGTLTRDNLRPDVERMLKFHNLIKKQALLVFIANLSTGIVWLGCLVDGDFFWENGWDNIVNSICVWMMLDKSKKYWKFCRKYGICWCCFRRANRLEM